MKTENAAAEAAPAKSGNLTLAGLSKALAKTSAPAPQTETQTDEETEAEGNREDPPGPDAAAEATESADLSQSDANATPEEGEGQETGETDSADSEATTTEPTEPEQTASVADTVRQRLEAELKPLIDELTQAGSKGALKVLLSRFPKLTDQRDTERNKRLAAEERVTQLESELETARREQQDEARPAANPSTHPAVAAISTQLDTVDRFLRTLKANPDGMEMDDGEGGTVTLSAEEVSEHLEKLRDKRTQLLARKGVAEENVRQQYQAAFHQVHAEAVKLYPWLANPNAPEQVRMRNVLKLIPGLKAVPDYERLIARMFRGKAAEEAELAAKGKAPTSRKAPPARTPTQVSTATPSSKAVPKAGPADKAVADAEAQYKKTGSLADLKKLERAREALKSKAK